MQRDFEALLWDVHEAGRTALEFTADKSLEHYLSNKMLRAAVERQFGIIGEALPRLRQFFPEDSAKVPSLAQFVGLRNRLAHEYHRIEDEKVWTVLREVLPRLVAEVEVTLDEWHQG